MAAKKNPNQADTGEKTYIKTLTMISEMGVGSNPVMVDVKDGKIIRLHPLHYDWKSSAEELGFWELKARGKTLRPTLKALLSPHNLVYKKRIYSPNRVMYPLKRVDWDPKGERNPEKRGESKYIRISWKEAVDIIADELKRIKAKYGMSAVLAQADGHGETKIVHAAHALNCLLLKELGGYTLQARNPDSWEGLYWGAKHVWGMDPVGLEAQINTVPDIAQNSEMILYWGSDPETTPWAFGGQMCTKILSWFKEIGIKAIYINPDLNYGAAIHADKWIPILPNTDAAMRLAIAYDWITKGTYDKAYVKTHVYGFDKFSDYVLGKEDGIPKTPKWAEPLCGVPSRIIKALAKEWASKTTSMAKTQGGGLRGPYSSEPGRLEVILLGMQGLGKPGVHQLMTGPLVVVDPPKSALKHLPMLLPTAAYRGTEIPRQAGELHGTTRNEHKAKWGVPGWTPPPITFPDDDVVSKKKPAQIIAKDLLPEAILNPPVSWYGTTMWGENLEDQFVKYTYPAPGCSEIHMIWTDTPCWITCWNDSNHWVKALRSPKIEFLLAQQPWMENDCQFADLVLPVSTKFEETDISMDGTGEQYDAIFREDQCIDPVGESKSDYDIVCMIAEKMGLLEKVTGGKSVEEWIKYGFDNSGATQFITWEDFQKKGYFAVPSNPSCKNLDENKKWWTITGMFYEDPVKHPLKTPSGKLEFSSQNLAKYFPDDKERPPVPHWIPFGETHQESRLCERAKQYPLLIISNHGRWRVHANNDDATWCHEVDTCKLRGADGYLYEPIWMNPVDAEARGIKYGDIVKVFNERGVVLAGAYVTERMMEGSLSMDHGARYDGIVPGEIDRGGAINTLTPRKTISKNVTGMVCSAFLVEVEKADMDEFRKKYPEAFNRPYHQGAGLTLDRLLQK